jgi:hypothetical protein
MFAKSTGDEPGAGGGVVSQVFAMEATFLSFRPRSPDTLPPASLLPPVPEDPLFCLVDSLIFSCGHGERGYSADLMATDLPVLQVISARHEPEQLEIETSSSCGFGHDYCPPSCWATL